MSQLVDFTYGHVEQEIGGSKSVGDNRRKLFHWMLSAQALLDRLQRICFRRVVGVSDGVGASSIPCEIALV